MKQYIREPINALTHLFGALISIIGTFVLITHLIHANSFTINSFLSVLIFGISLTLLYSTSAIYHLVFATEKVLLRLRKLDHSMIFILIAGSYTPFCVLSLADSGGKSIIITIWALAFIGIILKVFWMQMPRWLSTSFYILMGWIVVFVVKPLYLVLPNKGFYYLVLGGVFYTIGGIIYGAKKPNLSHNFGFHELFHLFVMLGSLCHYWTVLHYVV